MACLSMEVLERPALFEPAAGIEALCSRPVRYTIPPSRIRRMTYDDHIREICPFTSGIVDFVGSSHQRRSAMDPEFRKHLEADGWGIGTVQEFLGLTDAEA